MKWNKGDWCFYRWGLHQIKEVDEGRVSSVSDGSFSTGGYSLTVFPLSLRNCSIAHSFEYYDRQIHGLSCSLNFPDIARYLETLWEQACNTLETKEEEELKEVMKQLRNFYSSIRDKVNDSEFQSVQGVKIFK